LKARGHLVEGYDLESSRPEGLQSQIKEIGRDLEQTVRRERGVIGRAHVMEGQDDPAALRKRAKPTVGLGRRDNVEPCGENLMSGHTDHRLFIQELIGFVYLKTHKGCLLSSGRLAG
jgi:hypothetical protein